MEIELYSEVARLVVCNFKRINVTPIFFSHMVLPGRGQTKIRGSCQRRRRVNDVIKNV